MKAKIKRSPKKAIRTLENIRKNLDGPGRVKVGLPRDSNNYPDGTSVILVGTVQEFGSPTNNIPERSFLRSTVFEKRQEYMLFFKSLGNKILKNEMKPDKALRLLGLQVQTDVREKITTIDEPPLKSREGNPLVDTGHLRSSINFKVD